MPSFLDLAIAGALRRLAPPPPPPSMPLPLSAEWFAAQSAAREAATEPRGFSRREYATAPPPPENLFSVREYAISAPIPEIEPGENRVKSPMVVPPGISFD